MNKPTLITKHVASAGSSIHYRRPGLVTRKLMNPLVAGLARLGVSVAGSRVLEVRGRRSGVPRRVPVNVLHHGGRSLLVSARGEGEWVRNVRAANGQLDLLLGRRRTAMQAAELDDDQKVDVIRAYLKRWGFEVGAFFDGVDSNSSDAEITAIAGRHPVFVLEPRKAE